MNYKKPLLALTAIAAAMPALSAEFSLSDQVKGTASVTLTAGSTFRMDAPNPEEYAYLPSTQVPGAGPGQLYGQTGGSDLNFKKGQAVSTVTKAFGELTLTRQNFGVLLNGSAWYDFALGHDDAAYGNYPSRYATNAPLGDAGFSEAARFNGFLVHDAYLFGNFKVNENQDLSFKLGQQTKDWGGAKLLIGSIISAATPMDYAAITRPGALPQEAKVSEGMLSFKLASNKAWGVEGFVPYESRASVLPGCGTFFDTTSIVPDGCNLGAAVANTIGAFPPLSTPASLTELGVLGSGLYVQRAPDVSGKKTGQFGLSAHYFFSAAHTDVTAYALNTNSSMPFFQMTVENYGGNALPNGATAGSLLAAEVGRLSPADLQKFFGMAVPAGASGVRYGIMYPSAIQTYGLSFDSAVSNAFSAYGELAYRPNQPLGDNTADLVYAFLTRNPSSLLNLNKNILAIAGGGTYNGFDRFGVVSASLGFTGKFANVFGANMAMVVAELGISHVNDLPNPSDPNAMRYGRSLAYGTAPWAGMPSATASCTAGGTPAAQANGVPLIVPGKTCTTDGFITANAAGFRLRASAVYGNVLGVKLTPTLLLADDISGYSYDGVFSAGRVSVSPQLRADWNKTYFTEVRYTHFGGGKYNLLADRSNATLVLGAKF